MYNNRKTIIKLRVNDEELKLFLQKSARYPTMSSMIRDAVRQFDDRQTMGKLQSLTELKNFYVKYEQQLGWLGSNFNQYMHRANELNVSGQLTDKHLTEIILPVAGKGLELIREIKRELDCIHSKLLKL